MRNRVRMPYRICLGVSGLNNEVRMPPGFLTRYADFFLKSMCVSNFFHYFQDVFIFFIDLSFF